MRLAWIAIIAALTPGPQHVRGSREPLHPPGPDVAPGLRVDLRTRDDRTRFRLYESIPLEIRISSSSPGQYSIEVDRGWNAVAGDIDWLVSPGDAATRPLSMGLVGFACCSSRRVLLTPAPEVFRDYLTAHVRFPHPGEYQVQYRTREVFRGTQAKGDKYVDRGDVSALSNVMTLTILPDDPEWDAAMLDRTLAILDEGDASRIVEEDRRRAARAFGPQAPRLGASRLPAPAAMRYYDAVQALQVLDTPAAILERVPRIVMPSEQEWRQANGNGYRGVDDNLVSVTTRLDLVVDAVERRAAARDFGVQYGFVNLWMQAVMQRDAPELSSSLAEEPASASRRAEYRVAAANARNVVLAFLREAVASKTGIAADMTTQTITMLERNK
jgi:hypothetical protein